MNENTDVMKNLFLPVFLIAGSLFASCTSAVFKPIPSANPWDDNYLSVAKMENYRQWGTYNVHDPSCRKLGDYYYCTSVRMWVDRITVRSCAISLIKCLISTI